MKTMRVAALAALLVVAGGCTAQYRTQAIVGKKGGTAAQQYFGDVGIQGSNWNITIRRGSNVPRLSVLGHNNTITVEDGVTLYRIELAGNGNSVTIPENQILVRYTNVGMNQVVRRPGTASTLPNSYAPPTVSSWIGPSEVQPPASELQRPAPVPSGGTIVQPTPNGPPPVLPSGAAPAPARPVTPSQTPPITQPPAKETEELPPLPSDADYIDLPEGEAR